MQFGFALPHVGPAAGTEAITQAAQKAEALGFDSVWVLDRILWPLKPSSPYLETPDGRLPVEMQTIYIDRDVMLAAFVDLETKGYRALWGIFGYGSDGELTTAEIERALGTVAKEGGLLGAWGLTRQVVAEMEKVIKQVPTEASAIPLECARGATGIREIRAGQRQVVLTPLTTLTFYLSPTILFRALSKPAQAVAGSTSLEEANDALHALGIKTELDLERERAQGQEPPGE